MKPLKSIVDHAVGAGRMSMCAKSKRGAAVFHRETHAVYGLGFNGQPLPFECTGTEACRKACPKLCLHAEQLAIEDALADQRRVADGVRMDELEVVHVKVVDGVLVGGGGPSCWQCSRTIVHYGMRGIWLYELPRVSDDNPGPIETRAYVAGHTDPTWRFYSADEFHRETLRACELPVAEASR